MKKFVFVLMPFSSQFDDIYKLGIKSACESENIYCERVDEQYYEGSMLERIYNQINHADYLVADTTGKNPNVFYEIGYAHALDKKVILITQDGDDIPFDMKHFAHILYSKNNISLLKESIQNKLKWYLSNDEIDENIDFWNKVYINGIELNIDRTNNIPINLKCREKYDETKEYNGKFSLAIHNPTDKIFVCKDVKTSIVFSKDLPIDEYKMALVANDMQLIDAYLDDRMYPQSWWSKNIDISFNSIDYNSERIIKEMYEGSIYINMPFNTLKYHFIISLSL